MINVDIRPKQRWTTTSHHWQNKILPRIVSGALGSKIAPECWYTDCGASSWLLGILVESPASCARLEQKRLFGRVHHFQVRFEHPKVILDHLEPFVIHYEIVCWYRTSRIYLNALLSPKRIQSVPVIDHNYSFPASETRWITSEFAVLNESVGNSFSGLGVHLKSVTIATQMW